MDSRSNSRANSIAAEMGIVAPSFDLDDHSVPFGYYSYTGNEQLVKDFMEQWVNQLDWELDQAFDLDQYADLMGQRGLTFSEYVFVLKGPNSHIDYDEERVFEFLQIDGPEEHHYFNSIQYSDEETNLWNSYKAYLTKWIEEENTELHQFFFESKNALHLSLESIKRHVYILGKTGSGKSEIIKNLWFDLQKKSNPNRNMSLFSVEPQGKLSIDLLRFHFNHHNQDRVVYLDTNIRETAKNILGKDIFNEDYLFTINPFGTKGVSQQDIDYLTASIQSSGKEEETF